MLDYNHRPGIAERVNAAIDAALIAEREAKGGKAVRKECDAAKLVRAIGILRGVRQRVMAALAATARQVAHHRRQQHPALLVRQAFGHAVAHGGHQRMGGAQVDADNLGHVFFSLSGSAGDAAAFDEAPRVTAPGWVGVDQAG